MSALLPAPERPTYPRRETARHRAYAVLAIHGSNVHLGIFSEDAGNLTGSLRTVHVDVACCDGDSFEDAGRRLYQRMKASPSMRSLLVHLNPRDRDFFEHGVRPQLGGSSTEVNRTPRLACGCHCAGGCGDPYAACMSPCSAHVPY